MAVELWTQQAGSGAGFLSRDKMTLELGSAGEFARPQRREPFWRNTGIWKRWPVGE